MDWLDFSPAVAVWAVLLDAVPMPAALIDADGQVLCANNESAPPIGTVLPSDWVVTALDGNDGISLATRAEEDVRDHLLRQFFGAEGVLFVIFDHRGRIMELNEASAHLLGYERRELIGTDAWTLMPPKAIEMRKQILADLDRLGRAAPIVPLRTRDGSYREISWTFELDDSTDTCFAIGRDVTEERRRNQVLIDSHRIFENVGEFLIVLDEAYVLRRANPAFYRMMGYKPEDVVAEKFLPVVHNSDRSKFAVTSLRSRLKGPKDCLTRWRTAEGEWRWIDTTFARDNEDRGFHLVSRDVTEEYRLNAELHRRAFTDELTGLANRSQLLTEIDHAASEDATPVLLFCDLDRFKVINDSLGHNAGDELLRQLARRLVGLEALGPETLVARLGGDEFVVFLPRGSVEEAHRAAEAIIEEVNLPFLIGDRVAHVGVSVGVAISEVGTIRSAAELLSEADTAAYSAKELGRGRYVVFDATLRRMVDRRFNVEAGLHRALEEDGFELHYQPVVSLLGGGILGAEVLLRWRDGDGKLHYPSEFLDVAEETGLVAPIGDAVIIEAIEAAAGWLTDGREVTISVNVTASQLSEPTFVQKVMSTLQRFSLPPQLLILELTESEVVSDLDRTVPALQRLREAGLRVALDDFGTGYSSLSHLRQLPIDIVKIDRSFVAEITNDETTRHLISAVLTLCDALGLRVVAEGIETSDQAGALSELGCAVAQGFFYSRPVPAAEFERLLGLSDQGDSDYRPLAAADRLMW